MYPYYVPHIIYTKGVYQSWEVKTKDTPVRSRNLIQLPTSVCEELGLERGSKITVHWGKNYECVIITPLQAKLSDRTRERIRILTSEPLDTNR